MAIRELTRGVCAVALIVGFNVVTMADEVLPIKTAPIVFGTPLQNVVILEFTLHYGETVCRISLKREDWEYAKANNYQLPEGADVGQFQCERRN